MPHLKIFSRIANNTKSIRSQTTRIPGRVKLKQWENLLRPTFQMTINIDLLKLFLYFFFQKLGTPFVFSNFLSPVKNSLPA